MKQQWIGKDDDTSRWKLDNSNSWDYTGTTWASTGMDFGAVQCLELPKRSVLQQTTACRADTSWCFWWIIKITCYLFNENDYFHSSRCWRGVVIQLSSITALGHGAFSTRHPMIFQRRCEENDAGATQCCWTSWRRWAKFWIERVLRVPHKVPNYVQICCFTQWSGF